MPLAALPEPIEVAPTLVARAPEMGVLVTGSIRAPPIAVAPSPKPTAAEPTAVEPVPVAEAAAILPAIGSTYAPPTAVAPFPVAFAPKREFPGEVPVKPPPNADAPSPLATAPEDDNTPKAAPPP